MTRLAVLVVLTMSLCTVQEARAQVQWWPTEVALTTGRWVTEQDMQGQVDGMALGAQVAWMTRATNGWAAFFNGVEHGGFVGIHRIGASATVCRAKRDGLFAPTRPGLWAGRSPGGWLTTQRRTILRTRPT